MFNLLRQPVFSFISNHLIDYPTPENLSYNWNYGSLAGVCLISQIITGILVGMHYTGHVDLAFDSVQHLMRDVPYGWLVRFMHSNGASLFFIVVYLHIVRALFYSSYIQPRELVWLSGLAILLLMIITAFIGYVLPWGQMSFWGATVITSLATAIPVVGDFLVNWIWGGFSVSNPTLNRFLSLHYLLPFILAALSVIHLAALHQYGSTNPLGINASGFTISFYPYFILKDLIGFIMLFISFAFLVSFYPEVLGHPDNLVEANPFVTPAHIVPEWYYLWVYAILRSIPIKILGVLAIGAVFVALALLPFIHCASIRSLVFRPIHEFFISLLIGVLMLLTWLGSQPIDVYTVFAGQLSTTLFFILLLVSPFFGLIENFLLNNSNSNL